MKRLQFLMSNELVKELDALVEETGLKTRTQLLNTALTLFEWAVRERKSGRVIASVDEKEDKYKEIDLPGFPAVKQEEDVDTFFQQLVESLLKNDEWNEYVASSGRVSPWTEFVGDASTRAEATAVLASMARIMGPKTAATLSYLARAGGAAEVKELASELSKKAQERAEELRKELREREQAETAPERSHPKGK